MTAINLLLNQSRIFCIAEGRACTRWFCSRVTCRDQQGTWLHEDSRCTRSPTYQISWRSNGRRRSAPAFGLSPPEAGVYADGATMVAYPSMNGDRLSLSTSTLMIDGFPLAAARLMAGRISCGAVTLSPYPSHMATIFSYARMWCSSVLHCPLVEISSGRMYCSTKLIIPQAESLEITHTTGMPNRAMVSISMA